MRGSGGHGGMRDKRKIRVCIKASMMITTWFYKIIKKITMGKRSNSKEERKSKIIRLGGDQGL